MINAPDRFRITAVLMALVMGWFAIATIVAEGLSPKTRSFSRQGAAPDPISDRAPAAWAATALLRGDRLADIAFAYAAPARGNEPATPDMIAARERAEAYARRSLSLAPHASDVWLLLAMLGRQGPSQNASAELLKMSYLTSRADADLIPARLATMAASAAVADAELKSLASGDIRLILTRRPDLKPALASAYSGGSAEGRAFIRETVQSIDPGLAASLR